MNILLTVLALLIPAASIYAAYYSHVSCSDAHGWFLKAEAAAMRLRVERDRVTVLEREVEALRRELRKLSGKFYAELAAIERDRDESAETLEAQDELAYGPVAQFQNRFPVCENWALAKQQGPRSEAAKCACAYCEAQRAERARLRGELVPRTVQGQAELARLTAGKP